jgi:hypothetical protein
MKSNAAAMRAEAAALRKQEQSRQPAPKPRVAKRKESEVSFLAFTHAEPTYSLNILRKRMTPMKRCLSLPNVHERALRPTQKEQQDRSEIFHIKDIIC